MPNKIIKNLFFFEQVHIKNKLYPWIALKTSRPIKVSH